MPVWNVLYGDWNGREIKFRNVFDHWRLVHDIAKMSKRLSRDKELTEEEKKRAFAEELRRDMMYYYWSKCEWEVIVSAWPPRENMEAKIDVWDQVKANWDIFLDYTWEHRKDIEKEVRRLDESRTV